MHPRLLILGGTTESSRLAQALAGRDGMEAVLSLAGRTAVPTSPPLPFRRGGFGGAVGLQEFLRSRGMAAVVDATHPFATRIAAHARAACAGLGLPLAVYTRPPWHPKSGDRWTVVRTLAEAAEALGSGPRTVFLTTGRVGLGAFKAANHDYLIRTIDPPDPADVPSRARIVTARGPFSIEEEVALMRREGVEVLVTKNSGGAAVEAKLDAARALGLPVVMVRPPASPGGTTFYDLAEVLDWIAALQLTAP